MKKFVEVLEIKVLFWMDWPILIPLTNIAGLAGMLQSFPSQELTITVFARSCST